MVVTMILTFSIAVQAQTFREWFRQKKTQIAYYTEQIAALKAHNELLVDGYNIVRDGLQVAHDLRKGEFDLHHDYFQSLRSVNALFKTDQTGKVYANILEECEVVLSLSDRLPIGQQQYVQPVISTLRKKATQTYTDYQRLTTDDQYQLTDDERMQRIDETIAALHEQYAFVNRLYYGLQKMIVQEIREENDAKGLEKIYLP